jgi:hypothetical protein
MSRGKDKQKGEEEREQKNRTRNLFMQNLSLAWLPRLEIFVEKRNIWDESRLNLSAGN